MSTSSNAGFAVGTSQDQAAIGMLVQQIGSANWSQWQVIRQAFYDYVSFPAATSSSTINTALSFFSTPLGGQDPNSSTTKTTEDTNMLQQAQFGQQYFVVEQLRTHLFLLPKARQNATVAATTTYTYDQEVIMAALKSVMGTGVLTFNIGQKLYFDIQQPFRTCPPGFGLGQVIPPWDYVVANAANSGANANVFVQQSCNLDDVYTLTPPQLIEPAQTFQITLAYPDLGYNFYHTLDAAAQNANVKAGVILDGYLARPMQ